MKIEYILIACDNNPKFLSFLPSVSYHWKSMGYKVAFGLVTHKPLSSETEDYIRSIVDDFYVYEYTEECPYKPFVMSKLFRFYLSRYYLNNVVCVQDIDYYVFDNHQHVESNIRDPTNEVFTYGFNAYYTFVTPAPLKRNPIYIWKTIETLPNINGIEPNTFVFDKNGNVGFPRYRYDSMQKNYKYAELRFPATPMAANGNLIYQIFSDNVQESFTDFLLSLSNRQKTFAPPTHVGGSSSFDNLEFSDESLILQLNRTNNVRYHHVYRDDFENGRASRRIDPRCSSLQTDWISNNNGDSYKELMDAGHILDIQPKRPLENSQLMKDVFVNLNIPLSLLEPNEAIYGTQ